MKQFLSAPNLFGLALAGLGVLAGLNAAEAGDRDVAKVFLQANGAEQRIDVDLIALQPGQSRQLFTESGLPAIVSRDDAGLRIELAGETHEVRMPRVMHLQAGLPADGEARSFVIKREGDEGSKREVKVIRLAGNEGLDHTDIDALVAEALAEAEASGLDLPEAGEEGRKVRVIRRIEKAPAQ